MEKLPSLLDRKIYKSGQTRGADDDEIFQNRVGRNSTVLIPYHFWNGSLRKMAENGAFESGYIILIKPEDYFTVDNPDTFFNREGVVLGQNAVVFYETRQQWSAYDPLIKKWHPAVSRRFPVGGQFIARVPATTAIENGGKINKGFVDSKLKGAGIRLYEYADTATIQKCRIQLEAEYWLCPDSEEAASAFGMEREDAISRKKYALQKAEELGLLDYEVLMENRIIDRDKHTVCPLCLEKLSGFGFFNRMAQAEGREVPDLTITEVNLFHIQELRYGVFNHRPYNLGWGHHHCNVVVKDAGIMPTLSWLKRLITKNESLGVVIEQL